MGEMIKKAWSKPKTLFGKVNKAVRRLIIALLVITAVVIVAVSIYNGTRPYTALFTGLSTEDMSKIVTYLNGAGITDYKIQSSDTILVPEKEEPSLKAKLLMEGYPSSGFGYSMYLDNVNSLSTESDRQRMYLFDLQDRLGATVCCFDGVKDATVTIAQGEDNSFVLNRENVVEASASVLVTMDGAQQLTSKQVSAIRSLISGAVQGLLIDKIEISDTAGTQYDTNAGNSDGSSASLKLELESQVNASVRANIIRVLSPLFGAENISVSVNSTVDVSNAKSDSTTYKEPAWAVDGSTGGKGIIGSKVYDDSIVKGDTAASGVAGTESNSDISKYVESQTPDGTEKNIKSSGQIDYNVDTYHTQSETPAGVVSDVMVSISINSTAAGNTDTKALISHVARAAGISSDVQADKISILMMPFYKNENGDSSVAKSTAGIPQWVIYAAIAGAVLFFLILLSILLIIRGKRKKRAFGNPVVMTPVSTPEPPAGADILDVHSERSMELRKDVRQFADTNPEIAAQMVKNWLRGGDENHG